MFMNLKDLPIDFFPVFYDLEKTRKEFSKMDYDVLE